WQARASLSCLQAARLRQQTICPHRMREKRSRMTSMPEQLPPLQTLRAFEATGRRLSMTLAAQELHLTHGAVSRQIRALEEHLGVRLFHRMTRRIELTEAGVSFFGAVTRLLSELARETEDIRRRNDNARLVVSSGVSFASKWLTPRLHRL